MKMWSGDVESVLVRGNSKSKGLEAGMSLMCDWGMGRGE